MVLDESAVPSATDVSRDVRNADTRIMLTVSNLSYLNDAAIEAMIRQFERAYRIDMAKDVEVSWSLLCKFC
jgi:hypothetical protein